MLNRVLRKGEGENKLGADWAYVPPAGGITNSTADVVIKAAGAAGVRNYLTTLEFSAGVALANASEIVVKDGATVIWRGSLPGAVIAPSRVMFDPPLVGSPATALNIAAVTLFATGNLVVNARGYAV